MQTAPVGQFFANAWGVYDTHGNVFESVEDCVHNNYVSAPKDGRAWREENGGDCSYRVVRGGSWSSNQDLARSTNRLRRKPSFREFDLSFRVVCSSPSSGVGARLHQRGPVGFSTRYCGASRILADLR